MLNVFGGLGKLASSLGLPVGGEQSAEQSAPTASAPKGAGTASLRLAQDADATLQAGRSSAMSLDSPVTLEGIASTLNRIYTAQVA